MPTLAALILLLTAPAPVDRTTTFSEVETPASTTSTAEPAPTAPPSTSTPSTSPPSTSTPPTSPPSTATPPTKPWTPPPFDAPKIFANPTPIPVPPPPPNRPIRWRVDIVANVGGTVLRDRAWRAFDYNRHALQSGISLRADTRVGGGRVFLGGGASFRTFGSYGSLYSTTSTSARVREPLLFARLAVAALEGVDVFVQAGGGVSIVDLSFSAAQYASQRAVTGMADGQGGVALYLPKKWLRKRGASRATGGLEFAAGYTWRSPVAVRPQLHTDDDPISTSGAALGDLSLRGAIWRVGLFVRFQ
jgi:hypothetical protein